MLIVAAGSLAACGGSSSSPTVPTTPQPTLSPPSQVRLAVFSDPASTFSTSDVRDVQEQIVWFNTVDDSMIWAADRRVFTGYPVSGNFIRGDRAFQVRFGTRDGEWRAYFTEIASGRICDVEVVGGQLIISPTTGVVPGS